MENVTTISSAYIRSCVDAMRDPTCATSKFRHNAKIATYALALEALKTQVFPTNKHQIRFPSGSVETQQIAEQKIVVVAVLRAGSFMVDSLIELLPECVVAHYGALRGINALSGEIEVTEYYRNLPLLDNKLCIIVDPIIATGKTMRQTIQAAVDEGAKDSQIVCLSILAAQTGLKEVTSCFPAVKIFTAMTLEKLDDHFYIIHGLGDTGDRLSGKET